MPDCLTKKATGYDTGLSFGVRRILILLEAYYHQGHVQEAIKLLSKIKEQTEDPSDCRYFPKEDKYILFEIHNHNMKLRWYCNKMILLWRLRNLRKNQLPINNTTLDLEPIDKLAKEDTIILYYQDNQVYYVFHYANIMKTFQMSLENVEFGNPVPQPPCNPYTNEPLTLKQHIAVFDRCREIAQAKRHRFPIMLNSYSKYFDVKKFNENYRHFLCMRACKTYIKDIDEHEFNELFEEYMNTHYGTSICILCINKKLPNYRTIFTPTLIQHMQSMNNLIEETDYIFMSDRIIEEYDLTIKEPYRSHMRIHHSNRRIVQAIRRLNF
tara:strand:- start:340 stop:1314 length:975 start_codon:yes stop_codon:yes gene_type:complete